MLKGTGCRRCQACVSQSDVARHEGAEGIRLACRNLKCIRARGAEGAKLACRKAMWLGTRVPKA
ncbi:hypothetical protein Pyn_28016 [Prunus yedoensis var. nudiflora]|uniref:Uncharacterized protein n=1 Tax=Prunus yedoensis var. nudiflora TaxID=2094558 RepID=A0A314UFA0_PRUYE|nr:hypothetical protein Pyn_28016 [Prunus yedoensis var. nudiflora]